MHAGAPIAGRAGRTGTVASGLRNRDTRRQVHAAGVTAMRRLYALAYTVLLAGTLALLPAPVLAGTHTPLNLDLHATFSPPGAPSFGVAAPDAQTPRDDITPQQRSFRTHVLMSSPIAAAAIYGLGTWWTSEFTDTFRPTNAGWFGQDTYAGGADKLGHFYTGYVGTRLLTLGFRRWAGNGYNWSTKAGALTAFSTLATIEVLDGFSKNYRFSPQDLVMDGGGVALGALAETYPHFDDLFAFRVQYWPSKYAHFDPIDDYSGQTYLLALKASGLPKLRDTPVIRYLEFEVGYGTRDYESPDLSIHRRYVFVGISLNLTKLLDDTLFTGSRRGGAAQELADTFLRYVQMPGTVLLRRRALAH